MNNIIDLKTRRAQEGSTASSTTQPTSLPSHSQGAVEIKVNADVATGINAEVIQSVLHEAMVGHMAGSTNLKQRLAALTQRHEPKIRSYQELLKNYTPEQLTAFLNPKDNELQKRPYFYYAVVDETERRLNLTYSKNETE